MRLHLLGIPHTVTTKAFAHCAFTQKVYKFARMMTPLGYEVIHYGVEGSDSGATEDVVLMSQEEHQRLLGHPYHADKTAFFGSDAEAGNAVYTQWNLYARDELKQRVEPGTLFWPPSVTPTLQPCEICRTSKLEPRRLSLASGTTTASCRGASTSPRPSGTA